MRSPTSTSFRCRALLGVVVVLLGLAAPGVARAQTGPKERASALFDEANKLFARKMYLDALRKYREARALYPSFKIDLNIGGTLDALGRRTEAAVYFERFLVQSAAAPAEIIAKARERLEQLRGKLGRVKVTTILAGATISADGVTVGTAPLDIPVYFKPGEHRLEAYRPGRETVGRTITISAGQALTVDLSPAPAAAPPASAPVVTSPPPPTSPPPTSAPVVTEPPPPDGGLDPELVKRRRKKTMWAWIGLGVGGAFALTAAFLYGFGGAQLGDANERYDTETDPDKAEKIWDEDVVPARNKVYAGHAMAGLAAVGFGFAIYQFLTRPDLSERREAGLTVVPLAAGAALRGSF